MLFPGSEQVGFGKALLQQYPWHRFRPHPEWAEFVDLKWLSLADSHWLWTDTEKPPVTAAVRKRYFRRAFELPAGKEIARAHLRFVGVNHVEAQLNGVPAGTGWDRRVGSHFDDLGRLLRAGKNVLSIWVEHRPATNESAGLLGCLEVRFTDGEVLRLVTDEQWRCAENDIPGWQTPEFQDDAWVRPHVLGRLGDEPWGAIAEPNKEFFGPQSAGIPGLVRILYVPQPLAIRVCLLGGKAAYRAAYFDPIKGTKIEIGEITADLAGDWNCSPPAGLDHDWVLILEGQNS
jgi:hypothetical protein